MGTTPNPRGLHGRWNAMQAQRDYDFDADVEKMMAAYRASHPGPIEAFADAVSALHQRPAPQRRMPEQAPPLQPRQRGQFPDGSPVPQAFKRAVFDNYERLKAAYYAGEVDQADLPRQLLMNSAGPGGPSPLVRELYGLD